MVYPSVTDLLTYSSQGRDVLIDDPENIKGSSDVESRIRWGTVNETLPLQVNFFKF